MIANKILVVCIVLILCIYITHGQTTTCDATTTFFDGSFETGHFGSSGWTSTDLDFPYWPQDVRAAGESHPLQFFIPLFVISPTAGTLAAVNGFDGASNSAAPWSIVLSTTVTLGNTDSLFFAMDYRVGYDMATFGVSSLPRILRLTISGAATLTTDLYTAEPNTYEAD